MALKVNLTTEEYNGLDDVLKKEYQLQADGSYSLDLGGLYVTDKDPEGLKSALENEREETRKAKAAADRLEKEKIEAERAKMTDLDEVRKSFREEMEAERKKIEKERKEQQQKMKEQREAAAKGHLEREALRVSTELFGQQAPLMLPHIKDRMRPVAGDEGESPRVEFVDPMTGQPTIEQDFEKFKEKISTDDLFKRYIVTGRASGGSANDGSNSVLGTKSDGTPKTYADFLAEKDGPGKLKQLKQENPDEFNRLRTEHHQSR